MKHKSGFVNIIGNPNVGKSTLMNALVGEKLAIITPKAQTTRHRILGILSGEEYQIIFSDTPGILEPKYKLQESMQNYSDSALEDADILILLIEASERSEKNNKTIEKINKVKNIKKYLIINKIDTATEEEIITTEADWKEKIETDKVFIISALQKTNTDDLLKNIISDLPLSPAYFDKDQITDKSERFIATEILREKILMNYRKEIPYSVDVAIDEFKETDEIIRIKALIFVERDSQKGIIIGHKGLAIKKIGTEARIDMEKFFDKKVYLEQRVKVMKNWRSDENKLKYLGYDKT